MPKNRTSEINLFKKENYKRINLDLRIQPKENEIGYSDICSAAESLNISKTEFIKLACAEFIKRNKIDTSGGSSK